MGTKPTKGPASPMPSHSAMMARVYEQQKQTKDTIMTRITSKVLGDLASKVAEATGLDVDINHSSDYGGYQVTTNKGSTVLKHRGSARETKAFLAGIHAGIYLQIKGAAQ